MNKKHKTEANTVDGAFAKIINGFHFLTIFAKMFHHKFLTGFQCTLDKIYNGKKK